MKILSITLLLGFIISCNSQEKTIIKKTDDQITFKVDSVQVNTNQYKTYSLVEVIENKVEKKIQFISEDTLQKKYLYSSNNQFLQAIHWAYDHHKPLVLSPDDIWLTICQGVSIHINQNFSTLDKVLFVAHKPNTLSIRNDNLASSSEAWAQLTTEFSTQAQSYTQKPFYDFFVPQFSTTSDIETTAYQICMLQAYEKAFTYVAETGCGIPSITLQGIPKDWKDLKAHTKTLLTLGMKDYYNALQPILEEFINASEGKINQDFWKEIYKLPYDYGPQSINGWCVQLFPYIVVTESIGKNDDEGRPISEIQFEKNPYVMKDAYTQSNLTLEDFPSGVSKIKVEWKNHFTQEKKNMNFYSGFLSVEQTKDGAIQPHISWVVCNEMEDRPFVPKELELGDVGVEHIRSFHVPLNR